MCWWWPRNGHDHRAAGLTIRALAVALIFALVGAVPGAVHAASGGGTADRTKLTDVVSTSVDSTPTGTLTTTVVGHQGTAGDRVGTAAQRPGSVAEAVVPSGTQQIGLSWAGDLRAQFQIRTRANAGGAWSSPLGLEGDPEEAPNVDPARAGVGPVWLGTRGVSAVRILVTNGLVSDLRVDAMSFEPAASAAGTTTRAASSGIATPATPAGGPPVHVRSSWAPGGWVAANPECSPSPDVNDDLLHAVVHHADTSNAYAQADVPGILAGMYRFHTTTQQWCDIAYNFFVDRFGRVWEGRSGGMDHAIEGGHAKGFNKQSVGIALLGTHQTGGTYPAVTPSAAELLSLRDVLAWKLGAQGIDPQATVSVISSGNTRYAEGVAVSLPAIGGHGDNGYTSCPGDLARKRLPQLRLDVASRIDSTNDPNRWRPHVTGARYWKQMIVDAEGQVLTPSRIGLFTSSVVRAGFPQGELTAAVILSPAADGRIGLVDRLYRSAFGRSPDTAGLRTNVARRDAGTARRDLAHSFLVSSEFARRYGSPDNAAFTALLFRNALGREATQHDLDYWTSRLVAGLARQDMLIQFSQSAEHKARVRPQTQVTIAFFAMLQRAPSEQSRVYWQPRLTAGTPTRDLVVGLLRSAEYLARF